jgi:hypothetical protein
MCYEEKKRWLFEPGCENRMTGFEGATGSVIAHAKSGGLSSDDKGNSFGDLHDVSFFDESESQKFSSKMSIMKR